ncbi:MAG: hypothetical protein U9Q69_00030 [Nanoarchaeota archaeon]|nr:hypothetical protein [Nanoarchaeota archaeon]
MNKPINLAKPLLILKKGRYCTQPYNRYRSIYLMQEHTNSKVKLKKYLKNISKNWGNGIYLFKAYVKDCNSAFTATFTLAEVEVKNSKANVELVNSNNN